MGFVTSFRYSITTASAGDATAQSDPNFSLGKFVSTTNWVGTTPRDLFNDIDLDHNLSMQAQYRCLFVYNDSTSLTITTGKLYFAIITRGCDIAMGLDPTAASAVNSSTPQAVTIGIDTVAPAGVTFSLPTSVSTALNVGTLAPGECRAFWIRRSPTNQPSQFNDSFTVHFAGF